MKPLLFACLLACAACSPKIYINDRHTIMEDEAAGEWPQLEKEIVNQAKEQGPTAFQKTEINSRKKKLYNVLNGEMTTQKSASNKKE